MILPPIEDRDDWLAWRRGGLGASDIAGILGLSPWVSPWRIWADKVGILPPDDPLGIDDSRQFGKRAEAMIAPWFADETGLYVQATQLRLQHDEHDWMLATPDGAVTESPVSDLASALGGLEIKVDFGAPWYDGVPPHYRAQGQWQMACGGWERVWFAVLHGRRFRIYLVERDEADIQFMIEQAQVFWEQHVVPQLAPEIDGSDSTQEALRRLYPEANPESRIELDSEAARIVDDYDIAKAEGKRAEEQAKRAKNRLLDWMGDTHTGTIGDERRVTLRSQVKTNRCKRCGHAETSAPFRVINTYKLLTTGEQP